ncbi:ABC transporter substrate-binding protein [Roseicyclus sp.]|uniref:ABC transporter substrate-binding protein n=1 Tax=Roseicyclus sp. TaxID=1914329 RepID=UPI003F6BA775
MCLRRPAFALTAIICLGCAAPVWAQTGLCAGLGDGGQWMGQGQAGSDIASAAASLDVSVASTAGARAVGLFSLGTAMQVRVEAAPTTADGDTIIELFDADGRLLVIDDDSGGGVSSRAELALEPGSYCLAVMGFGGEAVRAEMRVSRLEMPALTAGLAGGFGDWQGGAPFVGIDPCLADTPAVTLRAGPIDAELDKGVSMANSVEAAPYYRFSLAAPQALSIRATNEQADPYIYLFDAAGVLLAENDDADSLDSRIDILQPLAAGDYCVGMRALSDPGLPIRLTISARGLQEAAAAAYATAEIAPPLDGSWPVEDLGVLTTTSTREWQVPGDQAQWFVFESPDAGLVLITADEISNSDPMLEVFDAQGNWLGSNDDANGSLDAELALPVQAGRYIVALLQFGSDQQGSVRLALTRYVPATP